MQPTPAGVQIAGPLVRRDRKLLGKNLIPFAEQVGISFQYLSQIETGVRTTVSPVVFGRICDALECDRDERSRYVIEDAA
jgi:transcriptional regulator with XRE-family HTH domain